MRCQTGIYQKEKKKKNRSVTKILVKKLADVKKYLRYGESNPELLGESEPC